MSPRRIGLCIICAALGVEQERELHGFALCETHYKQRLRRAQQDAETKIGERADQHIQAGLEVKAHMAVAKEFQHFLHFLNSEKAAAVIPPDEVHDLRLHLHPYQVVSDRIAIPKALPLEMQFDAPLRGDSRLQQTEGIVPLPDDEATREYRKAHARELTETALLKQRKRTQIIFELIDAGYHALEEKYRDSAEDFGVLTSATKFLRAMVGSEQ